MAGEFRNSFRWIPFFSFRVRGAVPWTVLLAMPFACIASAQTATPAPLAETAQGGAAIREHVTEPSGLIVVNTSVTVRNVLTGAEVSPKTPLSADFDVKYQQMDEAFRQKDAHAFVDRMSVDGEMVRIDFGMHFVADVRGPGEKGSTLHHYDTNMNFHKRLEAGLLRMADRPLHHFRSEWND